MLDDELDVPESTQNGMELYDKRSGVSSAHGTMYEIKMCLFIFLRLLNYGASFHLCFSLNMAGAFDDIVVTYTYNYEGINRTESLFIQLKHSINENANRYFALFKKKPNLDFNKYFLSFCSIHTKVDPKHFIFRSYPNERTYVIFLNANVNRSNLINDQNVSKFLCDLARQGEILKAYQCEGYERFYITVEKIRNEYLYKKGKINISECKEYNELKEIITIIENDPRVLNKTLNDLKRNIKEYNYVNADAYRDFISKTRICCNQKSVSELEEAIKIEIQTAAKLMDSEIETVYLKLLESINAWCEAKDSPYLTENSGLWTDVIKETELSRFKNIETDLLNCGIKFCDEAVDDLKKKLLQVSGILNIICDSDHTMTTTLKLWQALESTQKRNYLLVNVEECIDEEKHLWTVWGNMWCDVLVIQLGTNPIEHETCKMVIENIMLKFSKAPSIHLIFVSPKSSELILELDNDNIPYQDIDDVTRFHELNGESQEKIYRRDVNFQGKYIHLGAILLEGYINKLSSDSLSYLLSNSVVSLGDDLADKHKTENYISRRVYIPVMSDNILSCDINDTIIALEQSQVTSFKGFESIKTSRKNKPNTDLDNMFKYIVLTPGKEKEHFEKLCCTYENVHWIKELYMLAVCGTEKFVSKEDVEKLLHKKENTRYEKRLLWKKSKGNIDTIKKYHEFSTNSVDEENFIKCELESPVLITGDPGIGKSTLLRHMTGIMKKRYPYKWIVLVDLPNYSGYLKKINKIGKEHLKYIIKKSVMTNFTNFEERLFNIMSEKFENFIVLIDAFDEMSPNYTNKVKELITCLVQNSCFAVYIATRNSSVLDLETHFSVIACSTVPFSNEDSLKLFKRLIKSKHSQVSEKELESFCCELLAKSFYNPKTLFTANPLHLTMLSEIYSITLQEGITMVLNILETYTKFINMKCEMFFEKMGANMSHPNTIMEVENFIFDYFEYHKTDAVTQIFIKDMLNDHLKSKINIKETAVEKVGISEPGEAGTCKYSHRSFTEYFAALWLAENCNENQNLVKKLFSCTEFKVIKHFFDLKVAEEFPLHTAAIVNDEELVQKLSLSRKYITSCDTIGRTALHLAAEYNNCKAMCILIHNKIDVKVVDSLNYTPADYAFETRNWESLNALLEHVTFPEDESVKLLKKIRNIHEEVIFFCCAKGLKYLLSLFYGNIDLDKMFFIPENVKHFQQQQKTPFFDYKTKYETFIPIHVAAEYKQQSIIIQLADAKYNINIKDDEGFTLLHIGAINGDVDFVQKVMDNRFKFRYQNMHVKIINFVYLSFSCNVLDEPEYYIRDIDEKSHSGNTGLQIASELGYKDLVKFFVEHGADIQLQRQDGHTAQVIAALCGQIEIVKYFIEERGQHIDLLSGYDETALQFAALNGHIEIVKYCLAHNADIHHKQKDGFTALLLAAVANHLHVVKYLVEQGGADINCVNNIGDSAMLLASRRGHTEIVNYCVEKGADINQVTNYNESSLMLSSLIGHLDTVKYCMKHNANVDQFQKDGYTALSLASVCGHFEIVKYLVQNDADVNHVNRFGQTPLLLATIRGHHEIVEYLRGSTEKNSISN